MQHHIDSIHTLWYEQPYWTPQTHPPPTGLATAPRRAPLLGTPTTTPDPWGRHGARSGSTDTTLAFAFLVQVLHGARVVILLFLRHGWRRDRCCWWRGWRRRRRPWCLHVTHGISRVEESLPRHGTAWRQEWPVSRGAADDLPDTLITTLTDRPAPSLALHLLVNFTPGNFIFNRVLVW